MKRVLTALVASGLILAACGSSSTTTDTTEAAPVSEAAPASDVAPGTDAAPAAAGGDLATCAAGKTITEGTLTIATGEPAFPPYVINDKTPEDGQGLEAAVAMAVARDLGFDATKVKWVRTPFDAAIAPGPKDFDFNLQQFTINDERKAAVDFSRGYYTAAQAVFGLADSPAASAKTVADLQKLKIGVAAGTTSLTYIEETIKPTATPQVFNDNNAAKVALESKQVDAIVADLPTALYITAVEIPGTKVFGQIEGSGTDQFGLLLTKGSPLTACVDQALDGIDASGELKTIQTKWMSESTSAPLITAG
jgi:polar amino acid transport system substrate-binding protein